MSLSDQVERSENRVLSPGLVAYWKFDEGKGGTAHDATINRNNGTLNGPIWVEGRYNFALQFDGLDDYIRVAHADSLDLPDQFTIAAWVKLDKVGEGRQTLVQKAAAGEAGMDIFANYTFYVQWTTDLLALVIGDGERRVGLLSERGL
ncbi:MAG: LamG-like jellyroll fold domain-containing protein, partial [Candidatus Bathyarchaeia archaeon]